MYSCNSYWVSIILVVKKTENIIYKTIYFMYDQKFMHICNNVHSGEVAQY